MADATTPADRLRQIADLIDALDWKGGLTIIGYEATFHAEDPVDHAHLMASLPLHAEQRTATTMGQRPTTTWQLDNGVIVATIGPLPVKAAS